MNKIKNKIEKEPPTEFWGSLVSVFFDFCREKFNGREPSFSGSSPRDMKELIKIIRIRAEKKGILWDEEEATHRWRAFLEHAYMDDWLSRNFLLMNLNRFKDKVFLNLITPKRNGNKPPDTDTNIEGDYGNL